MKNALRGLLTVLLLPFTTASSIAIVTLMLALTSIFSPLIVLGATIEVAGKLSNKIMDWFFSKEENWLKFGRERFLMGIATTTILTPLLIAPIAVALAAAAALVSLLVVPSIAVLSAYSIAEYAINRILTMVGLNKKTPPELSCHSLTQNLGNKLEVVNPINFAPKAVAHFGKLFHQNDSKIIQKDIIVEEALSHSPK